VQGVVATGPGVHNLAFGLKGYKLTYGEKWLRINPTAANPYPINVFDPVYGAVPAPTPLPFTDNLETREVVTLYAQDLWEVNDRLSLSAGLRLDDYSQSLRNNRGRSGSFAGIYGQHHGIRPDALGNTNTDAVEPGDLGEAGNACGVKMRPHALQRLLWSAGTVGSFESDFLC
jgi:outer membrane receptor protein involved in Fe transport